MKVKNEGQAAIHHMDKFQCEGEVLIHKATDLEVEQAVHGEIHRLLSGRDRTVPEISAELRLETDLGFTSLELVKLIAALDSNLHVDLLAQNILVADLRTVGDISQAYQKSLSGARSPSTSVDELLLSSRRRAQARRNKRDR